MKKATYILSVIVLVFVSCHAQKAEPTKFSEAALNDQFISYEGGEEITLSNILKQYKGKTIVIDVWASWCGDCLKGLPKVKALQATYSEVEYVFLSLDRSLEAWKHGIDKYDIQGNHYYMVSGRKGPFGTFADLDWIPRYMVVSPKGKIKLFRAVEADDTQITELL
ncbi:TlpA family protein disulfide reductase [Gaetbulibacter saemankumensis]|uniref:TlpA family protein disulfide reductase n=1 Tax=Gaetbulibacter saemankumensis TaxID=311208 RepID=UPI00041E1965|nr:TlpA disulfide reductase family protein [Gaetbulibacter saemankumensis]